MRSFSGVSAGYLVIENSTKCTRAVKAIRARLKRIKWCRIPAKSVPTARCASLLRISLWDQVFPMGPQVVDLMSNSESGVSLIFIIIELVQSGKWGVLWFTPGSCPGPTPAFFSALSVFK